MSKNRYRNTINLLVLVAIACILFYDYLGKYKPVAGGIVLLVGITSIVLYFRRHWNISTDKEKAHARDSQVVELAVASDGPVLTSGYWASADSVEELMTRTLQLQQEVISNLLVQLEKSNWDSKTAKQLWANIDCRVISAAPRKQPRVAFDLSVDGRLITRPASKPGKSKAASSVWPSMARSASYQ